MPAWLINFLVSMAIKIGLPWLLQKFPWIPMEIQLIIEQLLKDLQDPSKSNSASRKKAINAVRSCTVGCAPELKKLD